MAIVSNIKDKILQLEGIVAAGQQIDLTDSLRAGVNDARAAMLFRIFNTGTDSNGDSLGKYIGRTSRVTNKKFTSTREDIFDSETKKLLKAKRKRLTTHSQFNADLAYTPYEKERLSEGRQIGYKDLQFYGSLKKAIITANDGVNKVVCVINSAEEAKIAVYQEQQIASIRATGFGNHSAGRAEIFTLSEKETTILKEVAAEALKQQYDRLLHTK